MLSKLLKFSLFASCLIYLPCSFASTAPEQNLMMHIFNLHSVNNKVSNAACIQAYQGQSDAPPLIAQKSGKLVMGSFSFWGGTEKLISLGHHLILMDGYSQESGVLNHQIIKGKLHWAGVRSENGGKFEGGAFSDAYCAGNYTVILNK